MIDEFDAVIGTRERAGVRRGPRRPPAVDPLRLALAPPAVVQPRPGCDWTGAVRDRPGRPALPVVGGRSALPRAVRRPLLPHEVAELERRTGGWVAALQLFNLATTALARCERRAAIAHVGRRSGPDWDFLADNVLDGLPDELQLFLLETAPLERLTAPLCDDLLGERQLAPPRRARAAAARDLVDGGAGQLPVPRGAARPPRGLLIEWEGADSVRKRYRQAAETLERHGQFAEALRAYCRGEDWPSAWPPARFPGRRGRRPARGAGCSGCRRRWSRPTRGCCSPSPGSSAATAAWSTRSRRSSASRAAHSHRCPVAVARRERLLLTSLLDRSSVPVAAVGRGACATPSCSDPVGGGRRWPTGRRTSCWPAGSPAPRRRGELGHARASTGRDGAMRRPPCRSRPASACSSPSHLAGDADPVAADDLERAATALDIPFLVRLCRAAGGMVTGAFDLVDAVVDDSDRTGDEIGAALAALCAAIARAWGPAAPTPVTSDALDRCGSLGLRTLEVWAHVAMALGSVGQPDGPALAARSRLGGSPARAVGPPGARRAGGARRDPRIRGVDARRTLSHRPTGSPSRPGSPTAMTRRRHPTLPPTRQPSCASSASDASR